MMDLDKIERDLMREVSGVVGIPEGAYNFRVNGKSIGRHSPRWQEWHRYLCG